MDKYEKMALKKELQERIDLLDQTTAGGMMGGYLEEGYPFYFINDRMLSYLGYKNEDEFVDDIHGLIDNCIHPDDRETVNEAVYVQIKEKNEYQVTYRMKKKDGLYIWVNDIGRKIITEDGREAITSVCYDITKEKEHTVFLNGLMRGLNAELAIFRLDEEEHKLIPTYLSNRMGSYQDLTKEEFEIKFKDDALTCVYETDKEKVWENLTGTLAFDDSGTVTFRVARANGELQWINAIYSRYEDGQQDNLVRALFTPVSIDFDLHVQALSVGSIGVCVIDVNTDELYYVNDACFKMYGVKHKNYFGMTCHKFLFNLEDRCEDCLLKEKYIVEDENRVIETYEGRYISINSEKRTWNDRNVMVIVSKDITDEHKLKGDLLDARNATSIAIKYGHLGFWTYDLKTKQLFQKFNVDGSYGYEQVAENIPESYIEQGAVHTDDIEKYRRCYQNILDGDKQSRCVVRIFDRTSGRFLWMRIYLIRQKDIPGRNHTAIGFSIDINEEVSSMKKMNKMQLELRRNQDTLMAACEFAGMWMWVYDYENNFILPSKNLQRDYGMPEKLDDFPESWFDLGFVAPEYVSLHRAKVEAIKSGSNEEEFECKMIHRDGSTHWARIKFNRLKNSPGLAVGTSQLIDDEKILSARIDMEKQKLLSSDSKFMGYVITNISRNEVLDRDGNNFNAPLAEIGNTLEASMESAREHIFEDDRDIYVDLHNREAIINSYNSGTNEFEFEGHLIEENGDILWFRSVFNILKDPASGDIFLYEYIYNIHSEKTLEELTIAATRYNYERVASINLKAHQMTVVEYDNRETQVWNYTEHSIDFCKTRVYEEDQKIFLEKINIDKVAEELEKNDYYEFVCRTLEDGKIRHKRTRFTYYNRSMGTCLMTRTDITEVLMQEEVDKRKLQDALDAAEAATLAKSQFLSRMSHEIRTPMNAIMGMTNIAKDNRSDFLQVSDCLDKIESSSRYLLTLINDILEMSRIESGSMNIENSKFELSVLINNIETIIGGIAVQGHVRYECINKIPENLDVVYYGDEVRVQQVMVNIITNAIKFTKEGGRVKFSIESDRHTDTQEFIKFTIADTGIGMSEKFMARMFDPFTQEDAGNTSKFNGSGLGLAISKNIIDSMGGTINVDSFVGIGTTFKIVIPFEKRNLSSASVKPETGAKASDIHKEIETKQVSLDILKEKNVLLVEDHPLNIMVATKLLEKMGVNITSAKNGRIAIDLFEESDIGFYDGILMDIRMPVMDGLDATKAIRMMTRSDAKRIPIIAMTANALDEDRQKSREAGMNEHLAKPFEPAKLYEVLARQIERYVKEGK